MKYFKLSPIDANDPTFKATSSQHKEIIIKAENEIEAREIAESKFGISYDNFENITGVWKNKRYVLVNEITVESYHKLKKDIDIIE